MRKKYIVPVRTHVSGDMIVFANSKTEAWSIAEKDMKESLERKLANAEPNEMMENLDGYTEAMKSQVRIAK